MIDLHMHSCYSDDGQYTPAELVEKCAAQNIQMMSITDHNCVRANAEAMNLAKEKGIRYIPGIEIDCSFKDTNFHVLGYGIDFESKDFEAIEQNIRQQSRRASFESLAKTQSLGFQITEKDMMEKSQGSYWSESWTGELFAEVLLEKPEYAEHLLLVPYRKGGTRSDNPYVNFYWDYYSKGKPCYSQISYPEMEEIIAMIHCNHGIAVLAHPGINLKEKEYLFEDISALGMDGVEAFSSYHNADVAKSYYEKASKKQLITTCGSDFHGKTKPAISLGQHNCFLSPKEITGVFNN